MTTCSSHVLDAALGVPAAGIVLTLADESGHVLASEITDADGRVRFEATLTPGPYTVRAGTGAWFAEQGRTTFFPRVTLDFTVEADQEHYHVALLLSPYAYTTYRGS